LEKGVLRFGPLTRRTVHLCVDMQNLFAEETPWHTPWMKRVLPVVERITRHAPEQTVFTRFIPAASRDELPGAWRRYYDNWNELMLGQIDPRLLELVAPLGEFVPPAVVLDKKVYSPFFTPELVTLLRARSVDSLVITGAETDVCVLAAVLGAVDHGYRVIVPTDAICSSSDETHDALLTLYRNRYGRQIETADSETVLSCWLL
jgi:nicotinamidase-related amidase